ncbi:MAG: hypothetical protein ACOCVK_02100, partial [bacterium]
MSEPRTIQLAFPGQILPSDSLEAYYSFDDGTATDQSGNGRNGTVEGATYTRAEKSRGCLSFDGVDDEGSVPSFAELHSAQISISVWVKAGPNQEIGTGTG